MAAAAPAPAPAPVPAAPTLLDPQAELQRATSDYLNISRNPQLYGTASDRDRAESAAWERLMAAQAAVAE